MNAQELIRSGLLEAYALGQASPQEVDLVERMRISDPEVGKELSALEDAIASEALLNAITPPTAIRSQVLQRISAEAQGITAPVIPIDRGSGPFNWLAAASVAGLLMSGAVNYWQYQQLQNVKSELVQLEQDRSVLANEFDVQRTSLSQSQEQLAVVRATGTRTVELNGMGAAANAKARVYWDAKTNSVFMDPMTLAPPPDGHQYQLWALVDGLPVDAGMIALEGEPHALHHMHDIPAAQAFAVTIEKKGGSPTPNLEMLVLMGQV